MSNEITKQITLNDLVEMVNDHDCDGSLPLALISHGASFPVCGFYIVNGEIVLSSANADDRAAANEPGRDKK